MGMLNRRDSFISDVISLKGRSQANFAFSTTATSGSALAEGIYDVWTDQDVYVAVGTAAVVVTSANGYLLRANNTVPFEIETGDLFSAVRSATSGTLSYHQVR